MTYIVISLRYTNTFFRWLWLYHISWLKHCCIWREIFGWTLIRVQWIWILNTGFNRHWRLKEIRTCVHLKYYNYKFDLNCINVFCPACCHYVQQRVQDKMEYFYRSGSDAYKQYIHIVDYSLQIIVRWLFRAD